MSTITPLRDKTIVRKTILRLIAEKANCHYSYVERIYKGERATKSHKAKYIKDLIDQYTDFHNSIKRAEDVEA